MGWYIQTTLLAALTVVTVDIFRRVLEQRIERKGHPLPPGPTSLPILGGALSVNTRSPWLTYTEWREKYGDIVYVRLLNSDVIILNSTTAATELFEKRSRIYSDRPFIPTVLPYGHDCNFLFSKYGEHWRLCRRIFHETFRSNAALAFRPLQLRRARELIRNLIDDPDEYHHHFHTFSATIGMSVLYDYEPRPRDDPMVSIINNYLEVAMPGLQQGKVVLLTAFPFLPHIPDWFPGSWISRDAKKAHTWKNEMVETPYKYVQNRIELKEQLNAAMVPEHIVRMEKFSGSYRSEYETALKHAAVSAFIGSVETTSSILMIFTLAMVENPHAWKRAQAEIDAVVGTDRLPVFDDRSSLPYVDAIMRETLRWRPVTPLLAPHAGTCSDVYEGYYIPKGATIFVNAWAISRDENRYPDAERFVPERFLDEKGVLTDDDPGEFMFGFGRRKCPGRYSGDASLWSAIAAMLATLDFNLAKDANGSDIAFEATFTNRAANYPLPFPCRLAPRAHVSKEALGRILDN